MSGFELYEWCMVLLPILNIYMTPIPGISIGEMLLLVFGIVILFQKKNILVDKRLVPFYAYISLVTVVFTFPHINHIGLSGTTQLLSYALYALLLLLFFNIGRIESFCIKYLKVARVICALTLFQYTLSIIGIRIPLIIPGIKNVAGRSFEQLLLFQTMSGPFTEPAHFAQFISVALILALIQKSLNRKDVVLFSVSMALTMKGTAVSQLALIFGIFFFRYLYSRNANKAIKALFFTLSGVIGIFVLYSSVDAVRVMFSRVYEIIGLGNQSLTGYYGVSGYFRVKYGFDFFHSLNAIHKVFGIGVGSFGLYDRISVVPQSILYLQETYALQDFRSGLTMILIDSGLIGLAIYLYAVFKDRTPSQRYFAFSLIVLQCMSGDMNLPSWLILMYLIFNYSDDISVDREAVAL